MCSRHGSSSSVVKVRVDVVAHQQINKYTCVFCVHVAGAGDWRRMRGARYFALK